MASAPGNPRKRKRQSGHSKLAMKVSEKGALGMGDEIRAFIEANNESLKAKE